MLEQGKASIEVARSAAEQGGLLERQPQLTEGRSGGAALVQSPNFPDQSDGPTRFQEGRSNSGGSVPNKRRRSQRKTRDAATLGKKPLHEAGNDHPTCGTEENFDQVARKKKDQRRKKNGNWSDEQLKCAIANIDDGMSI